MRHQPTDILMQVDLEEMVEKGQVPEGAFICQTCQGDRYVRVELDNDFEDDYEWITCDACNGKGWQR